MSETSNLGLPLLEPAQAQKHVTVNEAFSRLDGLAQLVLKGQDVSPPAAVEGVWAVQSGATNAWYGQDGRLAIASNGGWEFVTPRVGWRGFFEADGLPAVYDGENWISGAATRMPSGAGLLLETVEVDHTIASGGTSATSAFIPGQCVVFAVTGRVLQSITGSLSSFGVGIDGLSPDRYGSNLGLTAGSFVEGLTGSPVTYYSDTALTLTAAGGEFSAGEIRLCVHLMRFTVPTA